MIGWIRQLAIAGVVLSLGASAVAATTRGPSCSHCKCGTECHCAGKCKCGGGGAHRH